MEEESPLFVHLQCPLCAEVLHHHCHGRVALPPSVTPVVEVEQPSSQQQLPQDGRHVSAAACQPDEENLQRDWELDPVMAERFKKTADRRAQRKREREEREEREQNE
jgi:hypothetical protein